MCGLTEDIWMDAAKYLFGLTYTHISDVSVEVDRAHGRAQIHLIKEVVFTVILPQH